MADQAKKHFSHVDLRGLPRLLLLLQEGHDHQEEGVGRKTAMIGVVEAPDLEHLLHHEYQGLDQAVLVEVPLDEVDAVQSVVVVRHQRDINVNWLFHDVRIPGNISVWKD